MTKFYCIGCRKPWIGPDKCNCNLGRIRQRYHEFYDYWLQDKDGVVKMSGSDSGLRFESGVKHTSADLSTVEPDCNCYYCKVFGQQQWGYGGSQQHKDSEHLHPYQSSAIKSIEVECKDREDSESGFLGYLDKAEQMINYQLSKLNQLEEENRQRKNQLTINDKNGSEDINKNKHDGLSRTHCRRNASKLGSLNIDVTPLILEDVDCARVECYLDKICEAEACPNPNCDHSTTGPEIKVPCFDRVDTIEKIIEIAKTYHCKRNIEYNGIDMKRMFSLIEPLEELQTMIGLKANKQKICEQIVFFLKGYMELDRRDMMHTVITGPPGTGKTTFARIIGKIYSKLGLVSKGHFVEVTREDLVGKYLGHTAPKTNETIDKCLGGIMFIDEVYSLGHDEQKDSFSKECLDVLNQRLSENRDMLCIIAGYRDDIEKCFFGQNKGLKRRFPFSYDIEGYDCDELMEIFKLKVVRDGWTIDEKSLVSLKDRFSEKTFKFYAGDVETFAFKTKIIFAQTNFYSKSREIKKDTLETAFKEMEEDREPKKTKVDREKEELDKRNIEMMYI